MNPGWKSGLNVLDNDLTVLPRKSALFWLQPVK